MRLACSAAVVMISAALAQVWLIACTQRSYSDYPPGPDASGHDSSGSSSGVFVDDATGGDAPTFGDGSGSSGGDCAIPSGTYTVTATPSGDAGLSCTGSTSTITFPTSHVDGGPFCSYIPSGSPPACAVSFSCTSTSGGDATIASGFIEVLDSSIGGSETVVVTDTATTHVISNCAFTLAYAKH